MSTQAVVFSQLWQDMKDAEVKQVDVPTVLGGQFDADDLTAFLNKWQKSDLNMPWRIWEHISFIEFGKPGDMPKEPRYLQRAELFGARGHLSLRRDNNRWFWHFVGLAGTALPTGVKSERWKPDECAQLRCYSDKAILWGEEIVRDKDGNKEDVDVLWWEDRVGAADLRYPQHLSGISRVYLHFYRYTQAGHTVFAWYKGLGDEDKVIPWP